MMGITQRMSDALAFIEQYQAATGGVSPSVREIAAKLGSRNASRAHKILVGLEERGFIRRLKYHARAIEVLSIRPRYATFKFDTETKTLERFGPS